MEFNCSLHHATSKDGRLSLTYVRMEGTDDPYGGLFDFEVIVDGERGGYGLRFSDEPSAGMPDLVIRISRPQDVRYFLSIRDAVSPEEDDMSFLTSIAQAIVGMFRDARLPFDTRYVFAVDEKLLPGPAASLPRLPTPSILHRIVLASHDVAAINFCDASDISVVS